MQPKATPMFTLSLLTDFEINVIVGAVCFVVGMVVKTKVVDWATGVPSELRTALSNVQADSLAKIGAAKAGVIANLPQLTPKKVALAPEPAAPVAAAPSTVIVEERVAAASGASGASGLTG